MENVFTYTIHVPGALTADIVNYITLPFDAQLIHVSATGSNANDGKLSIGYAGAASAYLAAAAIGDSGTPAVVSRAGFVGGQYPHLSAGTTLVVTLDYDGASGVATQNYTCVLTFTKG